MAQLTWQIVSLIFTFFSRAWSQKIPRPFAVHYNPYTETVEILDNQERIINLISDVKLNLDTLMNAMLKTDHL